MARILPVLLALASTVLAAQPRTMRLDYFHTGKSGEEVFSLDEVVLEGDWPGPLDRWIDNTNLGPYLFEVVDLKTNLPVYSRGFASIYGEWQTTAEARDTRRTFSESVRFPAPATPVEVIIKKRDQQNGFHEVWSVRIDPSSQMVLRYAAPPDAGLWAVVKNGEPRDKVDLLLLGDGYTQAEMPKWHADAKRFAAMLFSQSPFKEHQSSFNVWALDTPAAESGVSRPSDDVWRRSPLGTSYDAFGSERYALTFDNKRLRTIAAAAPYEFMEIIMNGRKYGGGGIFNLYATVSSDNSASPYVFVHEFGHHFAGLADEYFTSDVAYEKTSARPEPWEPNATADPHAAKWAGLITPGTPLPTPWPQAEFEAIEKSMQSRRRTIRSEHQDESAMEQLFAEEKAQVEPLLAMPPYGDKVGAFEGALYEAHGYYRPEENCIMFTRTETRGFCAVCRRAITRIIALYARELYAREPGASEGAH
jgi:hypothetical protein